jgi:hypothetical protein
MVWFSLACLHRNRIAYLRHVLGEVSVLGKLALEEGGRGVVGRITHRAIDAGAIVGCLGKRGVGDKNCMEIANNFYPS